MFCYYLLEDYSVLMRDKTGVYSDGRDVEREWEKQYTGYIFEKKYIFKKRGNMKENTNYLKAISFLESNLSQSI